MISALDAPADRFAARTLVVDHYVVVMRRGHPAAKLAMDIEGFAKLPRLVISSSGEDVGFVSTELTAHGFFGPAALEAPYLSAGSILVAVGHGRGAQLSDRGGVPTLVSD